MIIGQTESGKDLKIDIGRLVESRLLLQANSGGGKSWAIRRIVEQAFGSVQIILIDPEGEFANLRSRFDFVYAGKDGDAPVESRSAALLARRLLELKASAIIDLYELKPQERKHYVKLFLDAMVDAPKDLWHDCLVVLDEAHVFAPEKAESEALGSVIDMASRGRKRGYCLIPATQRPAKLNKDVAAECNNKLIGRASLDIDRERSAKELGFTSKEDILSLRNLEQGNFYAFGPAISRDVVRVLVGDVSVKPPKRGQVNRSAPPPTAKVREILSKLADLPKEAEQEARTVADLSAKLRVADDQIRRLKSSAPAVDPDALKKEFERGAMSVKRELAKELDGFERICRTNLRRSQNAIKCAAKALEEELATFDQEKMPAPVMPSLDGIIAQVIAAPVAPVVAPRAQVQQAPRIWRPQAPASGNGNGNASMSKAGRRILTALAQFGTCPDTKVAALTTLSAGAGHFSNTLSELRGHAWIAGERAALSITDEGIAALGSYDPLPTGPELQRYWMQKLSSAGARILGVLIEAYPSPLSDEQIGERTGLSAKAGHFSNSLSELRTRDLISGSRSALHVSEDLF